MCQSFPDSLLGAKQRKVFVAQLCWTLGDPVDYSPPVTSVHGILQARILEWVDIPFSRGSSQCRNEPGFPALQADSLSLSHLGSPHRHILLIDRNNH